MGSPSERISSNIFSRMPKRYVFAIMGMLGMMVSFMMRACLSIAITQMVRPYSTNATEVNVFDWSEKTQGIILSSFYWGYIITHIPGGILADKFGGKNVFGFNLLFTSILTLITPWAAYQGARVLSVLRFLQGFFEGFLFPSLYNMLAHWSPTCERSTITTTTLMGGQLGSLLANLLGGVILNTNAGNWRIIFYFFGTISTLCSLLWYFLVYSGPESHPNISNEEKKYILVQGEVTGYIQRNENVGPTPWKSILTSVHVWALIVADFGHHCGFVTVITYLPKYMNDVIKINPLQNGIVSGLPFMTIFIVSWISSAASDYMLKHGLASLSVVRKSFATISSIGPAIGLVCASYAGYNVIHVTVLIIFGMACMALCYCSLKVNTLELSPNYSGTLTGLANGAGCIPGMVMPYFVGVLTPHRTLEEWRRVFFIIAASLIISNLIFTFFGSCRIQKWNVLQKIEKKNGHVI